MIETVFTAIKHHSACKCLAVMLGWVDKMCNFVIMDQDVKISAPFGSVMYIMAKPAGAACNLNCGYCYYLEKGVPGMKQIMSDATLEEYIRQYIQAQTVEEVCFTWHGGEAMMRPLSFYEKAMELQRHYGHGRKILNCLQTNGTLMNERWCQFLKSSGWLVGISIDGPREFHDEYRCTRQGRPSFNSVMRAIRMMQRYGVEWNAMAVINDCNVEHPLEFYRFFKQIGCPYIQFTPIVERRRADGRLASVTEDGELTPHSITPQQWGTFLCTLFDEWIKEDVGKVYVQIFDATLSRWLGKEPGICSMATYCGHAGVIEHNGDVYSCDHFVFDDYKLGNIHTRTITEMMIDPRQLSFGAAKRDRLPRQCRECVYTMICNGECPKNRFMTTSDGESGLNYLCDGYRKFFRHVEPYMDFMAEEYRQGRAPANVMNWHPDLTSRS